MGYLVNVLTLVLLFGILGVSLNWLLGYAGMFSVAHGAFLGIGAYTTAIAETRWDLNPLLAALLAIVVTGVAGTALGYTAIRVSGEFLIIASFGLQEVASSVYLNANGLTGGSNGIILFSPVVAFGLPPNTAALAVTGIMAVAAFGASHWLANSSRVKVGLSVRALREDEIALAASGGSVRGIKLVVHAGSFALVGLAGAVYAHILQFVAPDDFGLDTSVLVLTVVAIGGAGNTFGPLIGAIVAVGLPELLTFTPLPSQQAVPVQRLIYGALLVLFMLFRRNGLLNPDYRPSRVPARARDVQPEGSVTEQPTGSVVPGVSPPTDDDASVREVPDR